MIVDQQVAECLDVMVRMDRFLKYERRTSLIVSVEQGVFWARIVTMDNRHIEGESDTLLGAFDNMLSDYLNP